MTSKRWQLPITFVAGILFGAGLLVSGMTRPEKVLAFLDVFGAWDPSLALVMAGAIGVHAVLSRTLGRRQAPLLAERFQVSQTRRVDRRLVLGSAVFGIGWGLGGFCPGPSVVALPSALSAVWVFGAGLLAGTFVVIRALERAPRS